MNGPYKRFEPKRGVAYKTRNLFYNVCVLCGTAVVLAVTTKVIISLF